MIKSFGNIGTEDIFNGLNTKQASKFPREIIRRAFLLLHTINSAENLEALKAPPGNRLKQLDGNRRGIWSVRINDQWRITFKFFAGDFSQVTIEDYH